MIYPALERVKPEARVYAVSCRGSADDMLLASGIFISGGLVALILIVVIVVLILR